MMPLMKVFNGNLRKNLIYFACVVLILAMLGFLGQCVMSSGDKGEHNVYIDCPEWVLPGET